MHTLSCDMHWPKEAFPHKIAFWKRQHHHLCKMTRFTFRHWSTKWGRASRQSKLCGCTMQGIQVILYLRHCTFFYKTVIEMKKSNPLNSSQIQTYSLKCTVSLGDSHSLVCEHVNIWRHDECRSIWSWIKMRIWGSSKSLEPQRCQSILINMVNNPEGFIICATTSLLNANILMWTKAMLTEQLPKISAWLQFLKTACSWPWEKYSVSWFVDSWVITMTTWLLQRKTDCKVQKRVRVSGRSRMSCLCQF